MITQAEFEKIDQRLKTITEQEVLVIEDKLQFPPVLDDMEDNNKTYSMMVAILFIDIRKSTYLTQNSNSKSMVKIYRSFMRMAVDCVRKNDGVTRQFMGDRIMGVFKDTQDANGNITETGTNKAVNAARCMQTLLDYSLNIHLKNNVNGKVIECGIGIDYGKILVTKAGMYGVEGDDTKENEISFVWVGNATNYASKYSDLTDNGEIFISENAYKGLASELKVDSWSKATKYKGKKPYKGYSIKDFYLDYAKELGAVVKIEDDNVSHQDNAEQISDGIKVIEELQDKLFNKEKELTIKEEKLKKEKEEIRSIQWDAFNSLYDIIYEAFNNDHIVKKEDTDYWIFIIEKYYRLGKNLGKSESEIRKGISYCLSPIYDRIGMYKNAFHELSFMANEASWVNTQTNTLKWAKENNLIWDLRYDINRRMESDLNIDKESFQRYYDEVNKYYG